MAMRKRYFLTLTKGVGRSSISLYLYNHNGKFKTHYYLHRSYLMNWWEAHYWMFRMLLPKWLKPNGDMFAYKYTTGKVQMHRLSNEMLDK